MATGDSLSNAGAADPEGALAPAETAIAAGLMAARDKATLLITLPGTSNIVSAEFLRKFLLTDLAESKFSWFVLRGAVIKGTLRLEGIKLSLLCRFVHCEFQNGVLLNDSEIVGFELLGCNLAALRADRLTASGSLVCRLVPGTKSIVRTSIFLSGAKIRGNLDFRGCEVWGELVDDQEAIAILADGMAVEGSMLLSDGFKANGEVRLNGCQISRNLDCRGGLLANAYSYSLSAAGARIAGTVYAATSDSGARFESLGEFRLAGAQVDGDVDCTGGHFIAPVFGTLMNGVPQVSEEEITAFNGDGMKVGADLKFEGDSVDRPFAVTGQVSLIKARIGGDWIVSGYAKLDLPRDECLIADGIDVAQSTYLGTDLWTNGFLRFSEANFRGGLYAGGIHFDCGADPGKRKRAEDFPKEIIDGSAGIYAPGVVVGGTFAWESITAARYFSPAGALLWIYLRGSKAASIEDDNAAWQCADRFDVTGAEYNELPKLTGDVGERLNQLDRQYAVLNPRRPDAGAIGQWLAARLVGPILRLIVFLRALSRALFRRGRKLVIRDNANVPNPTIDEAIARFNPQPYLHLAKVVRAAGFDSSATTVLVRLEVNRMIYGDQRRLRFLGLMVLGWVLQYGYSPFRPLRILLFWFVISLGVFDLAYHDHLIVSTHDNIETTAKSCSTALVKTPTNARLAEARPCVAAPEKYKVEFNSLIFTLETLVPLIELDQKKNWTVKPMGKPIEPVATVRRPFWSWVFASPRGVWEGITRELPNNLPGWLLLLNAFLGWALWSFTAAGVTGLLRSKADD